jgi:hypothetical protein
MQSPVMLLVSKDFGIFFCENARNLRQKNYTTW